GGGGGRGRGGKGGGGPGMGGTSWLGEGGSNADGIVGESGEGGERGQVDREGVGWAEVMILLSARTGEQLKQKVRDVLDFIRPRLKTVDLVSMAYTLQVGREAMEERVGLVGSSVAQLAEKLEAYIAGKQGIEDVYQGQVKGNKELLSLFSSDTDLQQAVEKWITQGKVSKLLELWVKGLEVDWRKLYGELKPERMSLPTYPFARERYWIERSVAAGGGKPGVVQGVAGAVLHPLLHSNTSDLREQSYSARFSGEEYFLKDHEVGGRRVLPAGVYLEMARVAVQKALRRSAGRGLELRQGEWGAPLGVREGKQGKAVLMGQEDEQIAYEMYSQEGDEEIIHCQGRAAWSEQEGAAKLDMEQVQRSRGEERLEPSRVYSARAGIGLSYGPSLQA